MSTLNRFKILAIVDDVNACECCGKSELLRTVAIEDSETGEIKYFGTSCALQPVKGFGIEKKDIAKGIRDLEHLQNARRWKGNDYYRIAGGEWDVVMGKVGNSRERVISRTPSNPSLYSECQARSNSEKI